MTSQEKTDLLLNAPRIICTAIKRGWATPPQQSAVLTHHSTTEPPLRIAGGIPGQTADSLKMYAALNSFPSDAPFTSAAFADAVRAAGCNAPIENIRCFLTLRVQAGQVKKFDRVPGQKHATYLRVAHCAPNRHAAADAVRTRRRNSQL